MPVDRVSFSLVVRSHELDAYRHVNNAVYMQWFEEAREAFLRAGHRNYDWYPENLNVYLVVVRAELDFRHPARRDDSCCVHTRLVRIGERSLTFRHAAVRDDDRLLCEGRTVMAFATDDRSAPVPEDFRARFAAAPEGDVPIVAVR